MFYNSSATRSSVEACCYDRVWFVIDVDTLFLSMRCELSEHVYHIYKNSYHVTQKYYFDAAF
jgi:hypothetical protein